MNITELGIQGLLLFEPKRHGDERGFFSEVFRSDVFERSAPGYRFVQDNLSRTARAGTIRGLHYQAPPKAQGKLVRVGRGAVLDVAVDVRVDSATFGQHISVELSEYNWRQLWIPPGFLHGFRSLTDDVELCYKVTDYYSADHDGAVAFDDPTLAVSWGIARDDAVVSGKDMAAPLFVDWQSPFVE